MTSKKAKLKSQLDELADRYNHPNFIVKDPISIPHRYSRQQDIEIAGFFAATLAWGNRTSIIQSTHRILEAMDHAPYDFLLHHEEPDLKRFLHLKHRTFNATDLLYFILRLKLHYQQYDSLESAFLLGQTNSTCDRLIAFHDYFFEIEHPHRTRKHVSTPIRQSACKRLNMYLRWMVRNDNRGVDFGIWKNIKAADLICPLDVHSGRVALSFGLISENKANWKTAESLTDALRKFDPMDPVKYDFALFGFGVNLM
ncbi:MAG: TIGR02757 family protein [Chitinophagaceae bacterium]|nr:TIGR02757 family protein [Chitinophagaceae bacterium]